MDMNNNDDSKVLSTRSSDYVASAAKAVLGAVPFAGSLLAELAGTVIPNQRLDRVAKFAADLEKHIADLDQLFVRSQLTNENFTDLLEEGIRQAARSLSDERRQYLASVIANGVRSDDVEFFESKHLLRILSEINDVEVIILRFYLVAVMGGDESFREKHKEIIMTQSAYLGASQIILDKATLHDSYKEHLTSLGLLRHRYRTDIRTKQPEFDSFSGAPKIAGYELTSLGRLLLRHIGLSEEEKKGQQSPAPHSSPGAGSESAEP